MPRFAEAFSPQLLTVVAANKHVGLAISAQPLYVLHMQTAAFLP